MYELGRIVGAHGLKGELKLRCHYPEIPPEKITAVTINDKNFPVEHIRPHKGNLLLTLPGIPDLTAAEKFKNALVFVTDDLAKGLELYFAEDVLHKKVYDQNKKLIGEVTGLLDSPMYRILVVTDGNKEVLIPEIPPFVLENKETLSVDLTNLEEYK